jgi:signal transduction histidine kinase
METTPQTMAGPNNRPVKSELPMRAPKQRAKPLIRSAGIRFALLYAVVFGVSSFTLAFSLWFSTVGLLQRQVETAVLTDGMALTRDYANHGMPALLRELNDRLAENVDGDRIYLLVDGHGKILAGNLDILPAGVSAMESWFELPVRRQGVTSTALVRVYKLDHTTELLVGRDVRARTELRSVLSDGLLWAMGLMFGLGLGGAVLIRSLFRRMMRDISATTRAIARGDLTRRVPKTGDGDEFDELAGIINDMLDRITRLMDGVRQVSNAIAHDLRTPITRARTRLEDATLHAKTQDDLKFAIERATLDLDGIVGVFEALLRIAEIEAGSRRAAFANIELSHVLQDLDELYHVVAEERGLKLETSIARFLPMLGDRDLIQQAVANLLDNALKFAPQGTTIAFTARLEGTAIEISVADRGPGIAAKDRLRATERFFRTESARHTSGSGLGLALVTAVAQLHNGTLQLEDNMPGLRAIIALPGRW